MVKYSLSTLAYKLDTKAVVFKKKNYLKLGSQLRLRERLSLTCSRPPRSLCYKTIMIRSVNPPQTCSRFTYGVASLSTKDSRDSLFCRAYDIFTNLAAFNCIHPVRTPPVMIPPTVGGWGLVCAPPSHMTCHNITTANITGQLNTLVTTQTIHSATPSSITLVDGRERWGGVPYPTHLETLLDSLWPHQG